jgi:hypothetical protein
MARPNLLCMKSDDHAVQAISAVGSRVNATPPDNLADDYANRCAVLARNELTLARHLFWNTDLKVPDPGPNADRLGFRKASNAARARFKVPDALPPSAPPGRPGPSRAGNP